MKKTIISSILAVTACFTMVSQASAAPQVAKHHVAQIKHQKPSMKVDSKHQHVNKKALVSKHQSKKLVPNLKAKGKYQAQHNHGHHS